jgi:hypothetical protein
MDMISSLKLGYFSMKRAAIKPLFGVPEIVLGKYLIKFTWGPVR